jgi:hypothetical protein
MPFCTKCPPSPPKLRWGAFTCACSDVAVRAASGLAALLPHWRGASRNRIFGEVPRQRGIILNLSAFQKVKRREIHLCGLVHTDAAAGREFVYGVLDTERVAVAWSQ